ncbi:cation-transporting P-type ATPase [Corynebacterium alimapuense]|uniref:Carbonate dehydratase n=1 Tax=Corynebacterium alimapuense TaxID=1576874 RepID=A0A3M8K8H3_9CORY|nr:cation-transporting P-type ATPase [Corynebacterium alimapuense]RNE49179.1 carbonate dehydratase [Corynebacterium alimapuense]
MFSPYALAAQEVFDSLDSRPEGLSAQEVVNAKSAHGDNILPQAPAESAFHRLLRQFNDPMIFVLIGAAALTAVLGHYIDTIVIAAVVLINALVGFIEEGKAANALAAIQNMLSPTSQVRRDGRWMTVGAEELVPGDVVKLSAGDKVPADLRLFQASSLRIEEAALTGESVPSDKRSNAVEQDADLGDRSSMAFSSTTVVAGSGLGIATATGKDTEIGRITSLLNQVEHVETPLMKSMAKFSSFLAVAAVIMAALMAVTSVLLYDTSWEEVFMSAIGFGVAVIPEGLPAVMAITLALGVQKMADRKAITRRLNSVETLGSVTTICTDKTGTLTRNEMTVRTVVTRAHTYQVTGTGYAPQGEVLIDGRSVTMSSPAHPDLAHMVEVAEHANDAAVEKHEGSWTLIGEPTDGGIRTFALKAGSTNPENRIAAVPFDSEHKYMATLDQLSADLVIHLKGAPDRLLERCSFQAGPNETTEPMDRDFWEAQIEQLGSKGLRVLAAARRSVAETTTDITTEDIDAGGFEFLGLYGIIDPPRDEVPEAVATVQRAGVRVRMITGDHASTAAAIAREIGLAGTTAITGAELEAATDEQLREIVSDYDVFARTSPEHKLRLVRALQDNGEVVAMTGDGVNDAPSLKQADVGVAMGIKGTEATKEAADVVLGDDNFATIASAMKMGRTIYDNLRKAIVFMLPTNGGQGLVIFVAMLAGMTLPITALQVLWVNLITAVTLSLALSFEPSEPGIMKRSPRDPAAPLLDREAIIRILYVSALIGAVTIWVFNDAYDSGVSLDAARTVAVNTLVVGQIFYLFTARFSHVSALRRELFTANPVSWACVGIMLLLQLGFCYLPFMQTAFNTTAVNWIGWIVPLFAGILVFAAVEIEKLIRRRSAITSE